MGSPPLLKGAPVNMTRQFKYSAVVSWTAALLLFIVAGLEPDLRQHYSYYLFGVLAAIIAVAFTCLAALDSVVGRVIADEMALSREKLARGIAEALVNELERRGEVAQIRPLR